MANYTDFANFVLGMLFLASTLSLFINLQVLDIVIYEDVEDRQKPDYITREEARKVSKQRVQRHCNDTNVEWIRVTGESMLPFTMNSVKSFKKYTNQTLTIGDNVIFKNSDDEKIHHTIYNISKQELVTYGYGNNFLDEPINKSQVEYVMCNYGVPEKYLNKEK